MEEGFEVRDIQDYQDSWVEGGEEEVLYKDRPILLLKSFQNKRQKIYLKVEETQVYKRSDQIHPDLKGILGIVQKRITWWNFFTDPKLSKLNLPSKRGFEVQKRGL